MIFADGFDKAFEYADALADPRQLLDADFIMRRLCRAPHYAERALEGPAFP